MMPKVLERYWNWLHQAQSADSCDGAVLWTMCSGTVIVSRTFAEFLTSLLATRAAPVASAGSCAQQPAADAIASDSMATDGGRRRKGSAKVSTSEVTGATAAGFAGIIIRSSAVREAICAALCCIARWKDPKAMSHALIGLRSLAVQIMSGGESHQSLKDSQAAAVDAPARCALAVQLVLKPVIELARMPPEAPRADGVLHGVVGKPFADFFLPALGGGAAVSPFASGVVDTLWPVVWALHQVFVQVCKRENLQPQAEHLQQFPAMVEAYQVLGSLPRVSQQDVQSFISTLFDKSTDQKVKRAALRSLVCSAVDPAVGNPAGV